MPLENETTISAYNAGEWAQWLQDQAGERKGTYWKEEFDTFRGYLHSGSVLEIGAGIGYCADSLIAQGYDYLGLEPSVANINLAQLRHPDSKFLPLRLNQFQTDFLIDGFWASSSLLHIPKQELPDNLSHLRDVMREGSIGFISMKAGNGQAYDTKDRWFSYYQFDEFAQYLANADFFVLPQSHTKRSEFNHDWLVYFVRGM